MSATTMWLKPFGAMNNESVEVVIDPSLFQGMRGIFGPTLWMNFKYSTHSNVSINMALHSLEGWITWPGESNFLPGIAIPSQTIDPNTHMLYAPLTDEQIEAIEEKRAAGAVMLHITLRGLATIPNVRHLVDEYDEAALRKKPLESKPGPLPEVRVVYDQGQTVVIEREKWLAILDGLGAGKRRLIELPQPTLPSEDNARWSECLRLLTEATRFYRAGQLEQVLGNCRRVIEGVTEVLCNRFGIIRDRRRGIRTWSQDLHMHLQSIWPNDTEAANMFHALLTTSFTWTSSSHHYGSGIPAREEVSFALSLTTNLLVFGAQVLDATVPLTP